MQNLSNSGKELMQRWYAASDKQYNTTERMKLYDETKKLVESLKGDPQVIKKLSKAILEEVKNHTEADWKNLADWVAKNTSGDGYSGAYEAFHQLFETVKPFKDQTVLGYADKEALIQIKNMHNDSVKLWNNKLFPKDLKKEILGIVKPRDLSSM